MQYIPNVYIFTINLTKPMCASQYAFYSPTLYTEFNEHDQRDLLNVT